MIITLIGSMRFKKEIMKAYAELSLEGNIVFIPVDLDNYDHELMVTDYDDQLMKLHKEKIDLSERVHVMNVGGYVGRGTCEAIGYSTIKCKEITYKEPINNKEVIK